MLSSNQKSDLDKVYTTSGFHFGKATDLTDFDTAKKITETLNKHYSGYMWGVNVSSETGMVQVRNFSLSGEWGFNLHLRKVLEDVTHKSIIAAGGEILERYRVKRGRINHDQVDDLETDFAGRIAVDTIGAVDVAK